MTGDGASLSTTFLVTGAEDLTPFK